MLRFEGVFMIQELRRKGLAITEIARLTRRDRKTVRKHLQRGMEQPKYGPRALRARKIDPYLDYIRARLKACPKLTAARLRGAGCHSATAGRERTTAQPRERRARGRGAGETGNRGARAGGAERGGDRHGRRGAQGSYRGADTRNSGTRCCAYLRDASSLG